jgi:hypothetical protein
MRDAFAVNRGANFRNHGGIHPSVTTMFLPVPPSRWL